MMDCDESKLTVWVPAWGARHLHLMERYALASLASRGNLGCGRWTDIFVAVQTSAQEVRLAERAARAALAGVPGVAVSMEGFADPGRVRDLGLRAAIAHARARRSRFLIAMPDTVFGKDCLSHLASYAAGKNVVVAAPHLRMSSGASEQTLDGWRESPGNGRLEIGHADLVDLVLRYPHGSHEHAWFGRANNTWNGGISLRECGDGSPDRSGSPHRHGMATMVHHLPTAYLAWMTDADETFFKNSHLEAWDHQWPSIPVAEGRWRVVTDSDLFFAAELTDAGRNAHGPLPDSAANESYHRSDMHYAVNRCIVGSLKGMRSAECGVRNAEVTDPKGMRSAECGVRSGEEVTDAVGLDKNAGLTPSLRGKLSALTPEGAPRAPRLHVIMPSAKCENIPKISASYLRCEGHLFDLRWHILQQGTEPDPKGLRKLDEALDWFEDGWFFTPSDDTIHDAALFRRAGEVIAEWGMRNAEWEKQSALTLALSPVEREAALARLGPEPPRLGAVVFDENRYGSIMVCAPENIRPCHCDGSQFIWNREFVGTMRYDFEKYGGCADGHFAQRMFEKDPKRFAFIREVRVNFNSLEW